MLFELPDHGRDLGCMRHVLRVDSGHVLLQRMIDLAEDVDVDDQGLREGAAEAPHGRWRVVSVLDHLVDERVVGREGVPAAQQGRAVDRRLDGYDTLPPLHLVDERVRGGGETQEVFWRPFDSFPRTKGFAVERRPLPPTLGHVGNLVGDALENVKSAVRLAVGGARKRAERRKQGEEEAAPPCVLHSSVGESVDGKHW